MSQVASCDFPTFMLSLLSGNWLFFRDDEITWDGLHHGITGIQVNALQADQLMEYALVFDEFDDAQELAMYLMGFMRELEADDGLIVPRDLIASGVQQGLPEGDLTGITLANLAACGAAFQVRLAAPNEYAVIYDTRLAVGIPCFFDLLSRLLWDGRQMTKSMKGAPFRVSFMGARNFDADNYLGDVQKRVPGAQENPVVLEISDLPEINLPAVQGGAEEPIEQESLIGGFDDPSDSQAGVDLFGMTLNRTALDLPAVIPIEGTHHEGRAARIEHVKEGDQLILESNWESPYYHPVAIEVFNDQEETLGYLRGSYGFSPTGYRELACLLPHVSAKVKSVTPLSQRRKNAKYALMDVEISMAEEIEEDLWGNAELVSEAKALMAMPPAERSRASQSGKRPVAPRLIAEPSEDRKEAMASVATAIAGVAQGVATGIKDAAAKREEEERRELEQSRAEFIAEIESKIKKVNKELAAFNAACAEDVQKEIDQLEAQRRGCGVFQFKKRKEIDAEIASRERVLADFKERQRRNEREADSETLACICDERRKQLEESDEGDVEWKIGWIKERQREIAPVLVQQWREENDALLDPELIDSLIESHKKQYGISDEDLK